MGESEKVAYNPQLRGKLQEAGEVYFSIYVHNAKSKLKTSEDWKQERKDFYEHYKEVIEEAISYYYKNDKWQFGSFGMVFASFMLNSYIQDNNLNYNLTTGESREERERVLEEKGDSKTVKAIKRRKQIANEFGEELTQKSKAALSNSSQSDQKYDLPEENRQKLVHDNQEEDHLNDAQMKGLHDISGWLYRNVDHTGILGNSAYDFVNLFVKKQPARLKLLAYYLVEKKRRKTPNIMDVYESQTSYVPNLKEFKNQMIATKFKFWKRIDGSYIYWDKLGESMRIVLNAQGMVAKLASLAEMEQVESQSDTAEQGTPEEAAPLSAKEQQRKEVAKLRRTYYAKVVRCGFELTDLLQKKEEEEEKEKKEELSKQIQNKQAEIKNCYINMREADKKLVEFGKEDNAGEAEIHGEQRISADNTKTTKAAGYIGMGATAVDFAAKGFQHFSKVEMIGWGIAQADVTILNKISTVLSSASLLTSFISTVVTVCDWMNHSDRMSASECLAKTADLFASLASAAESGHRIAMAAKEWSTMANFTLGATLEANATSMGVVSAVTGGITAGVGATKAGIGLYRVAKVKSTEEKLKEQRANMTEKDADTAEAILGLQKRIAAAQATAGAFQAAAGVFHMAGGILNAAGVTLMVGTMVSMAGTVIGLAGSFVKFMLNKSNINHTIDTYLQVEKYLTPIKERIQERYDDLKTQREARSKEKLRLLQENKKSGTKLSAKEEKPEPESEEEKTLKAQIKGISNSSLREQIRVQAAAMAGFPNKNGFYQYIVEGYAQFLYNKVFYENGELILADSDEAKNPDAQRKLYIRMLHNSGLKPVYPVKRTDKPKPSLQNIVRKLRI